jgi:hypothetical protein
MNDIFSKRKEASGKVMVISGMGGIGKTQVARKFAGDHANEYELLSWSIHSAESILVPQI